MPRYVSKAGWVGIRLDARVDWRHVAALIEQSYRMIAPKRLAARIGSRA